METIQTGRRKVAVILVAVFVLVVLSNQIFDIVKDSMKEVDSVIEEHQGALAAQLSDDQKATASSQRRLGEASTTTTTRVFSLFSKLDRSQIIGVAVGGFLFMAAVAAAVTMGVLYHQGLSIESIPDAVLDQEVQKRFKLQLEREEEQRKLKRDQQEILDQKNEMLQAKAKLLFYVRAILFFGIIFITLISILVNYSFNSQKPLIAAHVIGVSLTIIMWAVYGYTEGLYCAAALLFPSLLIAAYKKVVYGSWFSGTTRRQAPSGPVKLQIGICILISIGVVIGPIIHMSMVKP